MASAQHGGSGAGLQARIAASTPETAGPLAARGRNRRACPRTQSGARQAKPRGRGSVAGGSRPRGPRCGRRQWQSDSRGPEPRPRRRSGAPFERDRCCSRCAGRQSSARHRRGRHGARRRGRTTGTRTCAARSQPHASRRPRAPDGPGEASATCRRLPRRSPSRPPRGGPVARRRRAERGSQESEDGRQALDFRWRTAYAISLIATIPASSESPVHVNCVRPRTLARSRHRMTKPRRLTRSRTGESVSGRGGAGVPREGAVAGHN